VTASAVIGPLLLLTIFLTAGLAVAWLNPDPLESEAEGQPVPPQGSRSDPRTPEESAPVEHSSTPHHPAFLQIDVNYAHDWVAAATDPSATVGVTLTDNGGALKDLALVSADDAGALLVGCNDWSSGQCPDVQPGDRVYGSSDSGAIAAVDPVGRITGQVDAGADTVTGRLFADWFPGPLDVRCELWEEPSSPVVTTTAQTDGGSYTCSFQGAWDLQRNQVVAVRYFEPDGDSIINELTWPWVRVNYAHDWVGANYEPGHSFWITVTDDLGGVKAAGTAESVPNGGWGGDGFGTAEWTPGQPDITPFDFVYVSADDGYTNTVEVGEISGTLDIEADAVSGPILAPGFGVTLTVECHPWGAWEAGLHDVQVKPSWAEPDGSVPFTCQWNPDTEWDIQAGQDVAVMYIEPGDDRVIDVYRDPAPHLRVQKWADGAPGEGGNLVFRHSYQNVGDAPAESVVISETLFGMTYLVDTSPFAVMTETVSADIESVSLDVGTVDPDSSGLFDLFVEVRAAVSETITNTVHIGTSSPYDQGEPEDKTATWVGQVEPNDTHLAVTKWAWTGDPAPQQDVVFTVNVCNNGATGSSKVTLTDTLHPALLFAEWWPQHPGWYEIYSDSGQLAAAIPSIPSYSCSEIYLRADLSAGLSPGDYISNTARIEAANDLETDDNEALWESNANAPHRNLWIDKWFNHGQLVPGGEIVYGVAYGNSGNVPLDPFVITDTFPTSTSFIDAWHYDPAGGYVFTPTVVTGGYATWNLPGLDHGLSGNFEVRVRIHPTAAPGTEMVNRAEISRLPAEDTYEDNSASWTEVLAATGTNLRIQKSHNWNSDGQLGYAVRFDNIGTEIVSSPAITDTLPAATTWDGWWEPGFDEQRLEFSTLGNQLIWNLDQLFPGETGWLYFNADLDEPGTPLRWYTNTVEITSSPGEVSPWDNFAEDIAFSGGEVERVELRVFGRDVWGHAPRGPITLSTSTEEVTFPEGSDFGWSFEQPLLPGETITVTADAGLSPVIIEIPDPFDTQASSLTEEVWGQVDHLDSEGIEVDLYGGPTLETETDGSGFFSVFFADIPRGGEGEVRYATTVDYSEVVFHRSFRTLDLVLDINYGHDWVEGLYEPGHTVWITVTESDGATVKGTAELTSGFIPGWADFGFSTGWDGWTSDHPDLVPGDWVFGQVDNGFTNTVQLGEIDFGLSLENDSIHGTVVTPWFVGVVDLLDVECEALGVEAPPKFSTASPDTSTPFSCQWDPVSEWDIQPGHGAIIAYVEPDGDRIYNTFDWPQIMAGIGPESGGNRHLWGHRAEPDASVTVTVTTELGAFVAGATAPTDGQGNWSTGTDLPEESLAPWNEISVDFGSTYTDTLTIYPMGGEADPVSNVVTVTAEAHPAFSVDLEVCQDEACGWYGLGSLGESGIVTANLMEQFGLDISLGAAFNARLTAWNQHGLNYLWRLPIPSIAIEKLTNGEDADLAPGPFVLAGHPITWTYLIQNSGEITLTEVGVVDDPPVLIECSQTQLGPGAQTLCSGSALAEPGQYANLATASGLPDGGVDPVSASDPSHYFGAVPSIQVEKLTNSVDADTPPGPEIVVGSPITWTYRVSNTGSVDLSEVEVTDDDLGPICSITSLRVDDPVVTCTATGTATAGQYQNTATVGGDPPPPLDRIFDGDSSHYYGVEVGIQIEKLTNDEDADSAPGPHVLVGEPITWTYIVTNTGDVPLNEVVVLDDHGVEVTCDPDPTLAPLDPGQALICVGQGVAVEGPYVNVATASALPAVGPEVEASDPSHYFGAEPAIHLEKLTNGEDADQQPGPYVLLGSTITWTYAITNTGNVTLTEINLVDDPAAAIDCPGQSLGPDETMTCTATGTASDGQFVNIATVNATPPGGLDAGSDTDPSHYFGAEPAIDLEKLTNGEDADAEPGPSVLVGEPITWTYVITNSGNVTLTAITLVDDPAAAIDCPRQSLAPEETMTCTATEAASVGQFVNIATVNATPPGGLDAVSDTDPSHYFGIDPAIDLEKLTNGEDADAEPGPSVLVGEPITWTYVITNTGNVTISAVTLVDDRLGAVDCPGTTLAVSESVTCSAFGTAVGGQYVNVATATGLPTVGPEVEASDSSHYFGAEPGITLEKLTNGEDADEFPGVEIGVGQPITWTYLVTNTGSVELADVTVTDDKGVEVSCPKTVLAPDEHMECTASGISQEGPYVNVGTAVGHPEQGEAVSDSDPSHYFGGELIFADDLESGDTSKWDRRVPP
jgi:uncharacterized repeat protein (TIGR01451 family)